MPQKHHKIFTYLQVIFLNLCLAGLLFWLVAQVFAVSTENDRLDQDFKMLETKRGNFSQLKSDAVRQSNLAKVLDGFFIEPDQKVKVIEDLEKISKKTKVAYVLNNASDSNGLALDVGVTGSFSDIYYFIELIETSNYWVTFNELSLSRQADKTGLWSGNMIILIPFTIK